MLVYGNHDEATLRQAEGVVASGAAHYVQCADGHLGYAHPIGGVAAYRDKLSLSGVGFDIGCGCLAYRTSLKGDEVRGRLDRILDEVAARISFGVGKTADADIGERDWAFLKEHDAWGIPAVGKLKQMARDQLGTVGSGNHYLDVFHESDTDRVWIAAHFGSRGLGHKITTHYLGKVGAKDGVDAPPALIDADSELGREYLRAMDLACDYAWHGRQAVLGRVLAIMDADWDLRVANHHNFLAVEDHFGEDFFVVRKGATPAFVGCLGFVGGSMGDDALIIEGQDCPEAAASLYSAPHGAGRVMSRAQAKGKKGRPGLITREAMRAWIDGKGVLLRGGDLDEAPQAYRRLDDVVALHSPAIKVVNRLTPIGVVMAPSDTFDPYKD